MHKYDLITNRDTFSRPWLQQFSLGFVAGDVIGYKQTRRCSARTDGTNGAV